MAGTLIIYVFGLFFLGVQTRGADVAKRLIPVTKCYGELGCLSTGGAFYDLSSRPLQLLPQERNDIDTVFLVYNRNTGGRMELLNPRLPAGISLTRFDPSLETKVIIHGFLDSSRAMWVNQTANEFLRKSDVNVILVDWEKGGAFPYHQATANTRLVGLELAQLITVLGNATGVQPDSFHLIGSGLGAHLASYTGNTLYGRLKRITGLDPAGPYFEGTDIAVRLDPSDAQFVDVIHTDADSLLGAVTGNGGMGMNQPCGHVDFYPNGGQEQPGCDNSIIDNIIVHGLFESGKQYVACSHIRAHDLFMDSINTQCPYTSYRCDSYENFKTGKCFSCLSDSCSSMGMKAGETKRPGTGVKYFLETAGSAPFCVYHYTVSLDLSKHPDAWTEKGRLYIQLNGLYASSDEAEVTEGQFEFQHGLVYKFIVTSYNEIRNVKSLTFRWEHDPTLYKPWEWSWFHTPQLYVYKFSAEAGNSGDRKEFCGYGQPVADNTATTFPTADSCR